MSRKIKKARRIMRKAFEKDPDFKKTYIANISVILYRDLDVPSETRYRVAETILDRIFSK